METTGINNLKPVLDHFSQREKISKILFKDFLRDKKGKVRKKVKMHLSIGIIR